MTQGGFLEQLHLKHQEEPAITVSLSPSPPPTFGDGELRIERAAEPRLKLQLVAAARNLYSQLQLLGLFLKIC